MSHRNSQRGFVALMSAIIISALVLVLMAGSGFASFYARYDALGLENKREAQALAESCVNVAILALATSTDPAHFSLSSAEVAVSENPASSCTIVQVTHTGEQDRIETHASVDNSFSSVTVMVTMPPNISIISWQTK